MYDLTLLLSNQVTSSPYSIMYNNFVLNLLLKKLISQFQYRGLGDDPSERSPLVILVTAVASRQHAHIHHYYKSRSHTFHMFISLLWPPLYSR